MNKSNFRKRNGVFRVRVSPNSNLLAFKVLLCIFLSQTFWGFPCLKTFRWQIVYVNYTFFLLFPHLYILFQSNTHKYIQYYNKWLRKKRLICKYLFQRRQWRPTSVLLPGKSHGLRSLEGCSPWGCWNSDMTEQLHLSLKCIGEENENPFQCSCLENLRDRGAWWAAIYGVTQSRTWLKLLSSSIYHLQRNNLHSFELYVFGLK